MTTIYVNEAERMGVAVSYDTAANPKIIQKGGCTITRAGAVATVARPDHGYTNGQTVTIEGADVAEYNGNKVATVTGTGTFTFPVVGTPATPATGSITVSDVGQSKWMVAPKAIQIESIAAATTVKVEACIRLSLGWQQQGADLTIADSGKVVVLAQAFNFVRLRRSAGVGAVKVYVQQ